MPRNSFVLSALEGGRTLANFLWIAMAAWWQAGVRIPGSPFSSAAGEQNAGREGPQPLQAFPALRRLSVHEPWLADPAVRVQRVWSQIGFDGQSYQYFIVTNGRHHTLGILMREHELAHLRLHSNYAFAAVDGTLWSGEIRDQPVRRVFITGGVDRVRKYTWSVAVMQRHRRCELQITTGGLIPWTHDFRTLDEAMLYAEICVTEFHHRDAKPVCEEPLEAEWVM
jgi:hypothetical protein